MKKALVLILMLYFFCLSQASAAPVVAITNPDDASTYSAGSSIPITASAKESGGSINLVSFYNGSKLLGKRSASPYTYAWGPDIVGTYTLTAVASDGSVSTTSNAVTVTITPAVPVVEITDPPGSTTYIAGSDIKLAATASEFNGTISTVSFYNGPTLLSTNDMTSTVSNFIWSDVPAGTYTLTAVATDTNHVSTTSSPKTITVASATGAPIAILNPTNNSVYTEGSNITIAASASEPNVTIDEVYFYNGSSYLGSSTRAPFHYLWKNVPDGTYTLTAEATDSNGGTLISAPVNIIVNSATSSIINPASGMQVPSVAIISPANNSTITNLLIKVNASENNSSIANVYFYNGKTLIGMSSTAPYTYTWGNVPAGTCTLTAQAVDVNGVSATSSPITVTVTK